MQHCQSHCHSHTITTFSGVASGSFTAGDHEDPSHLQLVLTATDANGSTASTSLDLQPKTVNLTFQTAPTGLVVGVNAAATASPFTRTVIVGSTNTISAAVSQSMGGTVYALNGWSDGGAASHGVVAGTSPVTYTATYHSTSSDLRVSETGVATRSSTTVTFRSVVTTLGPDGASGVKLTTRWSGA